MKHENLKDSVRRTSGDVRSFEELKVRPAIVRALKEDGIVEPTQIQEQSIPAIIEGKDLIGMSKTGSGKTAAFGIPVLELVEGRGLQTLILAPTRELAVQIADELHKFGKHMKVNIATVFGGVALDPQIDAIARSQIICGTPGRVLDHLTRGTMDLSKLRTVVLDEADKMVDMGFIEDIRRILDYTAQNRQVLLFGATISTEVNALKNDYMDDPVVAKADSHVKEEYLEQYYYNVEPHQKFSLLVHLLEAEKVQIGIIFCSARATVDLVTKNLRKNGIKAEMIHGKLSQNRRLAVMKDFHDGKYKILVASAVAARGLHIDGVSHVINYDLSQDPQEYIHRVGRTARAGTSGKAFTLLAHRDFDAFNDILSRYPVSVEKLALPKFKRMQFDARRSDRDGYESRGYGSSRGVSRGSARGFSRGRGSHDGPARAQNRHRSSESRFERSPQSFERSSRPSYGQREKPIELRFNRR